MRNVIIVSKNQSNDPKHMSKLMELACMLGNDKHPSNVGCCSGDVLDFQIEEEFVKSKQEFKKLADSGIARVIKLDNDEKLIDVFLKE